MSEPSTAPVLGSKPPSWRLFPASVLEVVLAISPATIGLTALVDVARWNGKKSAPTVVATWGLVVLLSFVGWGAVVNEIASPKRRLDFGLRAGIGAATTLFLGGLLGLFTLVSRTTVEGTVLVGLVCLGALELRRRREVLRSWTRAALITRESPLFAALLVVLGGAALVQYLGVAPHRYDHNPNDDGLAYFEFARQFLGSGTLIEPFSLRRIQSLGGQSYLHAIALVFGWVSQVDIMDRGVFVLLACALCVGILGRRPRSGRLAAVLAVMMTLSIPNIRINSTSAMTGAVFFLVLYRLLSEGYLRPSAGWRAALLIGLVGAAASTLRQNYIAGVALVVAFTLLARLVRARTRGELTFLLRHALVVAVASFAALLPWLALSYRSNRTFLFPFTKGDMNAQFSFLERLGTKVAQAQLFVRCVFYDAPVATFGFFVLAGLIAVDRRLGRPLPAFVGAIVLGGLALVYTFELSDAANLGRYFFSLEVAMVIGVLLDIVGRTSRRAYPKMGINAPALIAVIAAVSCLLGTKAAVAGNYDKWLELLKKYDDPPGILADQSDPTYAALQQAVPAGQPLMVMLEAPYRLDFGRNRIINLDLPGAASPWGVIPLLDGPEPLAAYLQKHSIRYIAFVTEATGFELYQHGTWEKHLRVAKPEGSELMYQNWARYFLAAFSDLAELAKTRKHLYDGRGDIVVLDLGTRAGS